jgi:putative DNA-invertase from lambdoid prophage Rac
MTFDRATTDPIQQAVRDALIAFMAATAQAEASKVAQRPGIAHTPILKTVGSTGARSPASRATSSGPSRTCSRWA